MSDQTVRPPMSETLRVVADLLEANPDLPTPCVWGYSTGQVEVQWQILRDAPDGQLATMTAIRRAVGGEWRKDASDEMFDLAQERYDGLKYQIVAAREAVCTSRVIGTETITIPAVEAKPEQTVERDVVEWDCAPVLAEASA